MQARHISTITKTQKRKESPIVGDKSHPDKQRCSCTKGMCRHQSCNERNHQLSPPLPPLLTCACLHLPRSILRVCTAQLLPGSALGVRVADRHVPLAPVGQARQGKTFQVQHHQQVLQPLPCERRRGGQTEKRGRGADEHRNAMGGELRIWRCTPADCAREDKGLCCTRGVVLGHTFSMFSASRSDSPGGRRKTCGRGSCLYSVNRTLTQTAFALFYGSIQLTRDETSETCCALRAPHN